MMPLKQCSRAAPRPSIATISADYLSLHLSLFIVTLANKINLQPHATNYKVLHKANW
jgi:hypothetical protein